MYTYILIYVSRSEKRRKNRPLPLFAEPAQVAGKVDWRVNFITAPWSCWRPPLFLSVSGSQKKSVCEGGHSGQGKQTPASSQELSLLLWSGTGSLAGDFLKPGGPMLGETSSRAVPDMHWQLSACYSFKESSWIGIKMWSYAGGIVSTTWLKFSSSSGSQLLYFYWRNLRLSERKSNCFRKTIEKQLEVY